MRGILTYHSVDPSGSPISIDEASFRAHVAWLTTGGVPVVPLARIHETGARDPALALTFDDGFRNFADVAWPLLRAHGLPVTLFVVSGHAGRTNAWHGREVPGIPTLPLMDWDALGHAAEEGVTLGAHSRTHPDLRTLEAAALEDELGESAEAVAARTGVRPTAFAYPYGGVNERVATAAAATYRCAVTTDLRPLAGHEAPHRLPRLDTYYLRDPDGLGAWGTSAFRRRLWLRGTLRRARAALTGRPA